MLFRPRPRGFTLLELVVVISVLAVLASLLVVNMGRTTDDAQTIGMRTSLETVREAFVGSAAGPGYLADMKHAPDFDLTVVSLPKLLDDPGTDLHFNPVTQRGWRGPYVQNPQLVRNTVPARAGRFPAAGDRRFAGDTTFQVRHFFTSSYGVAGDSALGDLWGNPIVLQIPPASAFTTTPTPEQRWKYARVVSAGPDGALDTPLDRLGGMTPDGRTATRGDDLVLFLNRADLYEP